MRLLLCLLTLLLGACSADHSVSSADAQAAETSGTPPPVPGPTTSLTLLNWDDYIDPAVLVSFTAETGIAVNYETYSSAEELAARLESGEPVDAVVLQAQPSAAQLIHADKLLELPLEQRALQAAFDPRITRALRSADPQNAHLLPYLWGTTGLGINRAMVESRLGAQVRLDSLSLLFDPAYAEKLADCGIGFINDEQEIAAAALIYMQLTPDRFGGEERALQLSLGQTLPYVRYFDASRIIDDLASGKLCVAFGYSGDILQAAQQAADAAQGVRIDYHVPREGGLMFIDTLAVLKSSLHPEAATRLAAFLLRPENIARISNHVTYANAVTDAEQFLDAEILANPAIYPPRESLATLYLTPNYSAEAESRRTQTLEAIVGLSAKWQRPE